MIKSLKPVLPAVLCLLLILSSCVSEPETSGNESQPQPQTSESEESKEVFVQSPDVDIIKQYVSQKTDTVQKGTNLFKGLKYT